MINLAISHNICRILAFGQARHAQIEISGYGSVETSQGGSSPGFVSIEREHDPFREPAEKIKALMFTFQDLGKPDAGGIAGMPEFRTEVQQKVIAAAKTKGRKKHILGATGGGAPTLPPNRVRGWVVGIGSSAGGTQTLPQLLPAFPSDFVPIVITQHMPPKFTKSFANMLNAECAIEVREAEDGDRLRLGTAFVAAGDYHLTLVRSGVEVRIKLDRGDKVSGHRPSVDVMFSSLARACRNRCIGTVLTGMGHDGADGVRMLNKVGAKTLAQDEESSLVYGMPMEAARTGVLDAIAPMTEIPQRIAEFLKSSPVNAAR